MLATLGKAALRLLVRHGKVKILYPFSPNTQSLLQPPISKVAAASKVKVLLFANVVALFEIYLSFT